MVVLKLEVGKLYWLADQGPMKLKSISKDALCFSSLDGSEYWATTDQLIREINKDEVDAFVKELKLKRVVREDFKVEWDQPPED